MTNCDSDKAKQLLVFRKINYKSPLNLKKVTMSAPIYVGDGDGGD